MKLLKAYAYAYTLRKIKHLKIFKRRTKKSMKKFLSTLAIAGVATLALASCNGGDATTTKSGGSSDKYTGKLTVWCSTSEGVSTLFKAKGEAWLKANGYDGVTLDVTPVSEGDAVGKVLEDLDAAADIYCFAQDQLSRAVTGNAIAKVANAYLDGVKSRNSEGGLISGTVGDTLYAYPLTNDNGYIMMYDKSVFEGVDMTDMTAIIEKCEDAGKNFSFNLGNIWYSAGFFFAQDENGERLCNSSWQTNAEGKFTGMIDTFNSDNGLIAMKGMYELLSSDAFNDKAEASEFNAATKSAVVVVGSWGASVAREILGDNFAATVLPKFTVDGKKYQLGSFSGSKLMGVKPQTDAKKTKVAHALADYLSGEEVQKALFKEQGWGGTNKNVQALDDYKNDEVLASLSAQANYAILQGQILGAWWTIGNAIKTNAAETDGSDAALKGVLKTYYDDLTAAFNLQGDALWVGANTGWNNANADYLMPATGDKIYEIEITFNGEAYKGGRIVKPASWDTLAGWNQVDDASKQYLDMDFEPRDDNFELDEDGNPKKNDDGSNKLKNGDGNLVFAEDGTYVITYNATANTITIVKK